MTRTVAYRLRNPAGGLAADLTAVRRPAVEPHSPGVRIHRNVCLGLPLGGLYWKDVAWLSFGVALSARALAERFPEGITIQVIALEASLSSYRSEVAALAMNQWVRGEFELPMNDVGAAFDATSGDYEFRWDGQEQPFADPFRSGPPEGGKADRSL
ncbi:hypothetical protein [Streptomyces sp. NBC_01314]|uniref:hypothetical protein n=1 Tax=Streptomyces sp. NBC_01314 TaxID=2903821 RepID=UPI00308BBDE2|nr:hypothetical protein OG622_18285 [Streptomyces sp. NBC_01314]